MDALGRKLNVTVSGLPPANFTNLVTGSSPYLVLYSAPDSENHVSFAHRLVSVIDLCQPNERTCNVNGTCSINGQCSTQVDQASLSLLSSLIALPSSTLSATINLFSQSSSSNATTNAATTASSAVSASTGAGSIASYPSQASIVSADAVAIAAASFQIPDNVLPVITILGPGTPFFTLNGSTGMISTTLVGSTYIDPGATAIKVPANPALPSVDLTTSIIVSGLTSVSTATPTHPDQPFLIAYDVKDDASPPNAALTVIRRLNVICADPEVSCTADDGSLYCSTTGVCGLGVSNIISRSVSYFQASSIISAVALSASPSGQSSSSVAPFQVTNSNPSSTSSSSSSSESGYGSLNLNLNGPSLVAIPQGTPYAPCEGAQLSSCELGATATLSATGDYNSAIMAVRYAADA